MEYIFRGGKSELLELAQILDKAAEARGVRMGTIKSTMILIDVLDGAQKAGIFEPVPEKGE